MPVQRVSKPFKDISASFLINPINQDLIALKNTNAIARSVRNLILTNPGERPFNPELGSNVNRLLFEQNDEITGTVIKDEIQLTIEKFEPRVRLNEVTVKPEPDGHNFDVTIQYYIVGIDVPAQELRFVLEPTR